MVTKKKKPVKKKPVVKKKPIKKKPVVKKKPVKKKPAKKKIEALKEDFREKIKKKQKPLTEGFFRLPTDEAIIEEAKLVNAHWVGTEGRLNYKEYEIGRDVPESITSSPEAIDDMIREMFRNVTGAPNKSITMGVRADKEFDWAYPGSDGYIRMGTYPLETSSDVRFAELAVSKVARDLIQGKYKVERIDVGVMYTSLKDYMKDLKHRLKGEMQEDE